MDELQRQINALKSEIMELRYSLSKKTGLGSADIKGNIVSPSNMAGTVTLTAGQVDQTAIGANTVGGSELKEEVIAVTVSSGNPSGTGTATTGSTIIGYYPTGNNDQFVDSVAISGTTVTVTLAANATADNTFNVVLIKA